MTDRLVRPITIEYIGSTHDHVIKKWTVRRRQLHRGPSLIGTIESHFKNKTFLLIVQGGSIGLSSEDLMEIAQRMRSIELEQRNSLG